MPNYEPSTKDINRLRGQVKRVTFHNEDNGWTVFKLDADAHNEDKTIVGYFPMIQAGQRLEIFGSWIHHKQFGLQFKAERSVSIRPDTLESLKKYLGSGLFPGLGPKTAEKIVDHFKEKTLDILEQDPYRITEVSSIGKQKALKIIKGWQASSEASEVMMFLNKFDVSPLYAARIYKTFEQDSIDIISENPYVLSEKIRGIGFLTADKIAQKIGISTKSKERICAGLLYAINRHSENGHSYISYNQLINLTSELLELDSRNDEASIRNAIDQLENNNDLIGEYVFEQGQKTLIYWEASSYIAEKEIANKVNTILQNKKSVDLQRVDDWIEKYSSKLGTEFSVEQTEAIKKSVCYPLFILTGGPGVGKTTTANAIIRLQIAMGKTICLAAPTGRAAKRLSEVTSQPAKTIHRLLEWNPQLGGFVKNQENPIFSDVIIIDEASMIDLKLANAFFSAITPNTQVILIGDIDQLPAIGAGNVLSDLLKSQCVPNIQLQEVFRQSKTSDIVRISHDINKGKKPNFTANESDCVFIETKDNSETLETITSIIENSSYNEIKFSSKDDLQILTPMHKGDLGTENLNILAQELHTKNLVNLFETKNYSFRPGDKVIQMTNNYDLGVFNGDIGTVLFDNSSNSDKKQKKLLVQFDEQTVTYTNEQILELKLAYAITIHKSQGSEFPVVIIPMTMSHYMMLKRNLIYTALTRGRKLVIFIGQKSALDRSCETADSHLRQTRLDKKISGEI